MPGATTLDTLETAFIARIIATTPRHTFNQANATWKHYESERAPSADARWFRIEWDSGNYTPRGFFGRQGSDGPRSWVDTTVTMTLVVDYGGIPAHLIKRVVEDDWYQLRDVLNRLKATVDGLRWLEADDWDFTNSDPNQRQAALQYRVRYMKERG